MRNIVLYIAQSIDGFIAKENGNVDWLTENEETNSQENAYGYLDFYNSIDTTLMGYNTYKEILNFDIPFPYPEKKNYVFSRKHHKSEDTPVEFVHTDIISFVSKLKQTKGKDIWLIGGSEINKQLLNANLIDQIIITIKTSILGSGIPLFAQNTDVKKFKIATVKTLSDTMVQLSLQKL